MTIWLEILCLSIVWNCFRNVPIICRLMKLFPTNKALLQILELPRVSPAAAFIVFKMVTVYQL